MTDDTNHLATDRLTALIAAKLEGFLDVLAEDMPLVESAKANGEFISLHLSYLPPLGEGSERREEHRELRLSPVVIPDGEPVGESAEDDIQAEPEPVLA